MATCPVPSSHTYQRKRGCQTLSQRQSPFRSDAKLVGIIAHIMSMGQLGRKHVGETTEENLARRITIIYVRSQLQLRTQHIIHIIYQRLQEQLEALLMMGHIGARQLILQHLIIDDKSLRLLIFEMKQRHLTHIKSRLPYLAWHEKDALEILGRHQQTLKLEIIADHHILYQLMRMTDKQVVLLEILLIVCNTLILNSNW